MVDRMSRGRPFHSFGATNIKAIRLLIIIIIIIIIITLLISSKRLFSLIYNVKYLKLSFPKIPLKMLFYFNLKYI